MDSATRLMEYCIMRLCYIRRSYLLCFFLLYCVFIGDASRAVGLPSSAAPPPVGNTPVAMQSTDKNWTYIGSKGGIETYVKHIEGSNLLAFRGVAYIDAHISQAMGPFMNLSMSHEWVSMLKHIQQYPITNETTSKIKDEDMIYQILELPWPLAPRDVLMHRRFSYDTKERTVTINYHSIEDDRCPITPHRVRAHSPQSMWRFRSIPPCGIQSAASLVEPVALPVSSANKPRFVSDIASIGRRLLQPISKMGIIQVSMRFINSKALKSIPQRVCLSIQNTVSMPVRIVQGFGRKNTKPPSIRKPSAKPSRKNASHNLANLQCSIDNVKEDQPKDSTVCTQKGALGTQGCWRGVGTVVEFESFVDSKAAVPAWFINYMQRSFPAQALSAYKSLTAQQRTEPLHRVFDW